MFSHGSIEMMNWKTWLGGFSLASYLIVPSCEVSAQQGYNTSNNRPVQKAPQTNPQGTIPQSPTGSVPSLDRTLNPGLQQPASPPAASAQVVTRDPYQDKPVSAQEQQYLDQLLNYWEQSTKNVDRLNCEFRRFQYDSNSNFVAQLAQQSNKNIREIKATAASGVVKYMKPDKGMYYIEQVLTLTGKLTAKNEPEMAASENVVGEYWICDGEAVHDYDRKAKKVTHYKIPKNMQGVGILESPMPFLFGVEAKKLKERYWMRPLQPPPKEDGQPNDDLFLIEAYPKFQQDAVNYDHVHIFLDRKEFLPLALIKYNPEHRDVAGEPLVDSREYYEFVKREKNASIFQRMKEEIFNSEFIPKKLPAGWTEETKEYNPEVDPAQAVKAPVFPNQPVPNVPSNNAGPGNAAAQNPLPGNGSVPSNAAAPSNNGNRTR